MFNNIKLKLLAATLAAASTFPAIAQVQQATDQQLEKALKETEAQYKAGNPFTAPSAEAFNQGREILGNPEVKINADPTRGGDAFGFSANQKGFIDFGCNQALRTLSGAGFQLKIVDKCQTDTTGQTISSVKIGICEKGFFGGSCKNTTDFTELTLSNGQFTNFTSPTDAGLVSQIGLGCNQTTKVCRISFDTVNQVSGNRNTMTSAGAFTAPMANGIGADFRSLATSDTMAEAFKSEAKKQKDCHDALLSGLAADGVARGCDGETEFSALEFKADSQNTCKDAPICKTQTKISQSFKHSCVRSEPLTTKACSETIPTQDCTETRDLKSGEITSSCSPAQLVQAVRVGETDWVCIETEKEKVGVDAEGNDIFIDKCVKESRTAFHYFPERATKLGCEFKPHPALLPEQCANGGSFTTAELFCPDSGIYGRTIAGSSCTVITSVAEPLFFFERQGCGACITPTYGVSCKAAPTVQEPQDQCQLPADAVCSLESVEPHTVQNGLVDGQKETYSCVREQTICSEYEPTKCSNIVNTRGIDKSVSSKPDFAAFARGIATMSVLSAQQQSNEKTALESNPVPRVFGGRDLRCRKPTGFLTSLLFNNCCRTNLERPGGSRPFHKCTLNEVRLAASRRADFDVYIGEYCSARKRFIGCIERTETYCVFDDMLPRIIHEQGRVQLAQIVAGSAGASSKRTALNYKFYDGAGGWTAPVVENGMEIAAWRQPEYCSDVKKATDHLLANPGSRECIAKTDNYFAVCEAAGTCGQLPFDPFDRPELSKWLIVPVSALNNATSSLTQYAAVSGACNTQTAQCQYSVETLPIGQAGKALLSEQLEFPVYSDEADTAMGASIGGQSQELFRLGETYFRPQSVVGKINQEVLPPTMDIFISTNAGNTYVKYSVPSVINGEIELAGTAGVKVSGGCNALVNTCTYIVTGEVSVDPKPFGGPTAPDCTGFNLTQLSALDFSKMDLSEWTTKIVKEATARANSFEAKEFATQATTSYVEQFRNGASTKTAPTRDDTVKIYPRQEYGPFPARIVVTGNWPKYYLDDAKNTDPVTRVTVDWGDCSIPSELEPVISNSGTVSYKSFVGEHNYASPDAIAGSCGGGEKNIEHNVEVTIFSASGVHKVPLRVINVFKDFPNQIGFEEGSQGKVQSTQEFKGDNRELSNGVNTNDLLK